MMAHLARLGFSFGLARCALIGFLILLGVIPQIRLAYVVALSQIAAGNFGASNPARRCMMLSKLPTDHPADHPCRHTCSIVVVLSMCVRTTPNLFQSSL